MQSADELPHTILDSYPKLISNYTKQPDSYLKMKPINEDRENNFDLFSPESSQLFNKSGNDSGFSQASSSLTSNNYFDENINLFNDNVNISCRIQSQFDKNENNLFKEDVELFRSFDDIQIGNDRSYSNNNEPLATSSANIGLVYFFVRHFLAYFY